MWFCTRTTEVLHSLSESVLGSEPSAGRTVDVSRVEVRGKFFVHGSETFRLCGVTYGPFRPDEAGEEYGSRDRVERDFTSMTAAGINTVRTYTRPPRWFLDVAREHGLGVMVGLAWEQHVTFLDDHELTRGIVRKVREDVRACSGHPAVLCYTIGNEIPAPIVRWHGQSAIRGFIERLYDTAKEVDPEALVTYVSYPTTEYLDLPFLDFVSFNVFLEKREKLEAYLARLQNIAGDRPLVLAEVGLDSARNGEDEQAATLDWQIRTALAVGCAGTCVFSWTDEWFRGGHEITDWSFGLVDREGRHKPAFEAVRAAFSAPLLTREDTPRISVVICTNNGEKTIRQCLEGVLLLDYADYEVIVVNDGSSDSTADIVDEFDVVRIDVEQGGLSRARNIGMHAATGEIVAYIDDDAYPDPAWLTFLALSFRSTSHSGIGGPNLPPPGDGPVADCVANSPGGPSHVLHSDTEAEHLPGCNMAFRREAILAIGGFDEQFWIAGDDVDLCWRLQEADQTLGFNPCALVWHHRRSRVRDYLRQQYNYGRAEGMLEPKWPEKYNRLGHLRWAGRLYGRGHTPSMDPRARRVDHGVWGSRLFQSVYGPSPGTLWSLTLMPEWYLVIATLTVLAALGWMWRPLAAVAVPLAIVVAIPVYQAWLGARQAKFTNGHAGWWPPRKLRLLTAALHLLQPLYRLLGRLSARLTPWRLHGSRSYAPPLPRRVTHWSETWRSQSDWLRSLETSLRKHRVLVRRGGNFDRWDLQADSGLLGGARLLSAVEEHGGGRQFIRVLAWPRASLPTWVATPTIALVAAAAATQGAWYAVGILCAITIALVARCWIECSSSLRSIRQDMSALGRLESPTDAELEPPATL